MPKGVYKRTKKHRKSISKAHMGTKKPWASEMCKKRLGENHPCWKGDNVKYMGLHKWIRTRKSKPKYCEICNKKPPYDLANISGEYKRDINDFEWLCRKCHMVKDGRILKTKNK